MIPINLSISGFLSYRDPVEVDFTQFELACIAGANGAGKSSILDAITWALFGQARKRDDSVINMQSEIAEVELIFEYEKNHYRVTRTNPRNKSTLLEFHIAQVSENSEPSTLNPPPSNFNWKPLTERATRATQTRIEETLRLDYETFVNAAFFLQGKADQFTQQRPGDRKRILASILGLEIWEVYRRRIVDRRKIVDAEITALDGRIAEINVELAEEDARRTRLAELEAELGRLGDQRATQEKTLDTIKQSAAALQENRKLMDQLNRQLETAQKRQVELETRLDQRQSERENHAKILGRAAEIEAAYQEWQAARVELARWDETAAQFREHEKRRDEPRLEIEAERARLTQELQTLEAQYSAVSSQRSEVLPLQSQIANLQTSISDIEDSISTRKTLEAQLVTAQEALANAKAENPRLKTEMDELKARIDQLNDAEGAACPVCGQPMNTTERDSLIEELNLLGTSMGDKYRANRNLLGESQTEVADLQSQITNLMRLDDDLLAQKNQLNQLTSQLTQIETDQEKWETDNQPRLEAVRTQLETETFAPEAHSTLAAIDAELKAIGYDAAEHDKVRRAEQSGRAAEDDYRTIEGAKSALEPLDREIDTLTQELTTLNQDLESQLTAHTAAASQLAVLETEAPDLNQAQRALLDVIDQENRLLREVGAAQQKVNVLENLKARRKKLESEREGLTKQVSQFKQLEKAFGKDGVPALLIEQALPQIEAKANEILERLSNGNMSIRFITQREYKDKKRDDLRETLDIQISDSAGVRDYEMFSGGEAFRVNFAVRLALSEVLAQRAGARLQTLVIDEGFGSQDAIGRQRLIEAINTVKSDFAKILVITHIESLKDAFPTRIEVTKTPHGSVVNVG
jgi:DNA repair protein SbcC/Rad50